MQKFVTLIIKKKLKDAKFFASQGGPIILAQIENEYQHMEAAFKDNGTRYIDWEAKMAISTCNGKHCGDTWPGSSGKSKPLLWTENWTAQVFGDQPYQRLAEDTAFAVARFFSVGGSMVNYYMYHGGTHFGRTSAWPSYYDEDPLDNFGGIQDESSKTLNGSLKRSSCCLLISELLHY